MPKLIYFDVYGKAEAIRMLCWKAGVEYEDDRCGFLRYRFLRWLGKLPGNQLPIWVEDDGTTRN